jgi:hypothetical protein
MGEKELTLLAENLDACSKISAADPENAVKWDAFLCALADWDWYAEFGGSSPDQLGDA